MNEPVLDFDGGGFRPFTVGTFARLDTFDFTLRGNHVVWSGWKSA